MTENLYNPGCIRTFTGKYINPIEPDLELICLEDIAHALSMQCRFGGHLPRFYSVAQHCVAVASLLPPGLQRQGLMHDASEAYLIDVPRPVKEQLTNYKGIENNLMYTIANLFSFDWPLSDLVKAADEEMLKLEWETLMLETSKPTGIITEVWAPGDAKYMFLQTFKNTRL